MSRFKPIRIPTPPALAVGNQPPGQSQGPTRAPTTDSTNSPALDPKCFAGMPNLLRQACEPFSGREKDSFFLASLAVLGSCMNSVYGVYNGVRVSPFLFFFIIAPAGSGKGSLTWSRALGKGFHKHRSSLSQLARQAYDQQLITARQNKLASLDPPPPYKALFIPGNISASAFLKALAENEEWGIIFETEADTLSAALKQDWGDFSDVLRKAFHHEPISFLRKTGERFELEHPALTVVLAGTPGQVRRLIPDAENGLFSRFLFYSFQTDARWQDVSPHSDRPLLEDHFAPLIDQVTELALQIEKVGSIKVELTEHQWTQLNEQMDFLLTKALMWSAPGISSTVYRLGLSVYRIAIILTILRNAENEPLMSTLVCDDTDFCLALDISGVLLEHALRLSVTMPNVDNPGANSKQKQFYAQLPVKFTRAQAATIAAELGIKTRSLTNYLAHFTRLELLNKPDHGHYQKP
jgi:hypothetical protein